MEQETIQTESVYYSSLSNREFIQISEFIHNQCGIKIPPVKKIMLEGRLRKRLKSLGMNSFKEYYEYLFSAEGLRNEIVSLIDVVTTNKTDFFRESDHFEFLRNHILPEYSTSRPILFWSAPCSSGEEAYTLAMVAHDYFQQRPSNSIRDFLVWGTDISTQMLDIAEKGIYDEQKIKQIPSRYLHRYFMRSKNPLIKKFKVVPELRKKCVFFRLNFMDSDYFLKDKADVVFCRNVIIYFDKNTQELILNRIVDNMKEGGYLFLGHSETLNGLNVPVNYIAPTIYQK